MEKERQEVPRDDIKRPRRGDIFTVKTAGADSHRTPGDIGHNAAAAENPFKGPYWMIIQDAEPDTRYRIEVERRKKNRVYAHALKKDNHRGTVMRWTYKTEEKFAHSRDEPIEWDGTPQSRLDSGHNDVMSEDDVRGDKNDLLGGHL